MRLPSSSRGHRPQSDSGISDPADSLQNVVAFDRSRYSHRNGYLSYRRACCLSHSVQIAHSRSSFLIKTGAVVAGPVPMRFFSGQWAISKRPTRFWKAKLGLSFGMKCSKDFGAKNGGDTGTAEKAASENTFKAKKLAATASAADDLPSSASRRRIVMRSGTPQLKDRRPCLA